jgi:hypothetical protein
MADPDIPMVRPGDAASIAKALEQFGEKTGDGAGRR